MRPYVAGKSSSKVLDAGDLLTGPQEYGQWVKKVRAAALLSGKGL